MGNCWSCGSNLPSGPRHLYTCPNCDEVEEVKNLRKQLESSAPRTLNEATEVSRELAKRLSEIATVTKEGLSEIAAVTEEGLSNISSVIEWGFEEISWKLDQQTNILRSIDKTLKKPGQTQANEWRQIAEKLRERGVLDESENFFLKSLESNPLDYRTYIGLGKTCLQMENFDDARTYWERSLPHAPKEVINYKSYSYRLIGRIHFCEGNYKQAVLTLQSAIELSPYYADGYYDYAQYCALIGDQKSCLSSIRNAIFGNIAYFYLAPKERNFVRYQKEVQNILSKEELFREAMIRNTIGKVSQSDDTYLEGITLQNHSYIRMWDKNGKPNYLLDLGSVSIWQPVPLDARLIPLRSRPVLYSDNPTKLDPFTTAFYGYFTASSKWTRYELLEGDRIKQTEIHPDPSSITQKELGLSIISESQLNMPVRALLHPGYEARRRVWRQIQP